MLLAMTASPDREPSVAAEPGTICPYLLVASGHWRNAEPSREHVCTALAEPVPVGLETQRRLCFGDHTACTRYEMAVAAYSAAVPLVPLRPIARTTPVVVDRGRAPIPVPHVADRRTVGQAVLVVAMIAAVGAVLVARLSPSAGGAAASPSLGPSGSSVAVASPTPTVAPSPTENPTLSASPPVSPTPKPTPRPTPTPTKAAGTTYTVKAGDTLSGIAARFGTTVKAIQDLNDIQDPSLIRTGQVLKIP
jgi:LysM repeat protein